MITSFIIHYPKDNRRKMQMPTHGRVKRSSKGIARHILVLDLKKSS
jgi:hypothetical protein